MTAFSFLAEQSIKVFFYFIILFYSIKYFRKSPVIKHCVANQRTYNRREDVSRMEWPQRALQSRQFFCISHSLLTQKKTIPLPLHNTHTYTHNRSYSNSENLVLKAKDISTLIQRCTANRIWGPELSI